MENSSVDEEKDNGISIIGKGFSYRYSRGLLAHSLEQRGLSLEKSYIVAKNVNDKLNEMKINSLPEDKLRKMVKEEAIKIAGNEIAENYNLIEKWHQSSVPLVILLCASRGIDTPNIGKKLAERLAMPRIVSTSILSKVLRRMISPDMAPELHTRSYLAYKKLRPFYSVLYDKVIIGFEEHSKFVAQAVDALVKRAIVEGISMLIRGEHLVPRYLSDELSNHPCVIYVTLNCPDIKMHRNMYLEELNIESKQKEASYFEDIRKIHDYLIEEAKNRNKIVIDFTSVNQTVEDVYKIVLDRLKYIFSLSDPSKLLNYDIALINS